MHTCRKELNLLGDLLHAQRCTSEWQFLPAIIAIQSCDARLSSWHGVMPLDTVSHMTVVAGCVISADTLCRKAWTEGSFKSLSNPGPTSPPPPPPVPSHTSTGGGPNFILLFSQRYPPPPPPLSVSSSPSPLSVPSSPSPSICILFPFSLYLYPPLLPFPYILSSSSPSVSSPPPPPPLLPFPNISKHRGHSMHCSHVFYEL